VRIVLPGGVGEVEAVVRRFLEHDTAEFNTTRWGVEFSNLTVVQRAHIARLVFAAARQARDAEAS
jgi:c-di-GMP-binding flagellar brake protein YcgR